MKNMKDILPIKLHQQFYVLRFTSTQKQNQSNFNEDII